MRGFCPARILRGRALPFIASAIFACLPGIAASPDAFAWRSVNIQGMGYVTGLVIHPLPPYDVYIRTDVGGAYRCDRGASR